MAEGGFLVGLEYETKKLQQGSFSKYSFPREKGLEKAHGFY